jgi:hypothetical protein
VSGLALGKGRKLNRKQLADALHNLAQQVESGEIDMLDVSDDLRGYAYEAENIYD